MDVPTVQQIDDLSRIEFEGLDAPFEVPDELQPVVDQANVYMQVMTGRQWDTMPTLLEPVALAVSRMRTEQIAFMAQPDYVETINDDAVSSFSAGSYSETRTPLTSRGIPSDKMLNVWPELNDALWMLMIGQPTDPNVDAMREWWLGLVTGVNPPAFAVSEVNWSLEPQTSWMHLRWSYDPLGNIYPDPYGSWQSAQ